MRHISAIAVLIGASLAVFATPAGSTGVDLYGAFFKTGHPTKGESIETAVASETDIGNLKLTVKTLARFPTMQFEVTGHTDPYECSGQECHDLALRRALLVYRFLLDAGVDAHRIVALTEYASARPIAGKREDYWRNQRAEVNITVEP